MTRSSISKNTLFIDSDENSVFWMNLNLDRFVRRLKILFVFAFPNLSHLQHNGLSRRKLVFQKVYHIFHIPMKLQHFLMVGPTLLWSSGGDEVGHLQENSLRFPNEIVLKEGSVVADEPEILDLFLGDPPSLQNLRILSLF